MVSLQKPDCYKCKYRGSIPGDAHSCCNHPLLGEISNDPLGQILAILARVGRVPPIQMGIDKLGIKANYHGIKNGWFNFPFNFDPYWLEECDGYETASKE